jgi:UDP-glucose 4-epimerase
MPNVVLVTGVSRYLGSRLAGQLAADPDVDRVMGVDTTPVARADRARLGRTEFVRADIRNPLISRVMAQAGVDTVVHAAVTATPRGAGGRTPMKELNVIGTMQLLGACQKSETVRRLVVKSTTAVYGSGPRDPAVFTEDMAARALPAGGYAKDAVEVEGYVRGFARRRPDITVSVLRFANFVGPTVDTPLTRYLALPVVPVAFGFDPRLQLLHEDDAIEVLRLAALRDRPGVYNVAGPGVLLLSQALRRAGRLSVPVPAPGVRLVASLVQRRIDASPEQSSLVNFGRVVDITRLRTEFAYRPQYSTPEAFESLIVERPLPPVIAPETVRQAELTLGRLLRVNTQGNF